MPDNENRYAPTYTANKNPVIRAVVALFARWTTNVWPDFRKKFQLPNCGQPMTRSAKSGVQPCQPRFIPTLIGCKPVQPDLLQVYLQVLSSIWPFFFSKFVFFQSCRAMSERSSHNRSKSQYKQLYQHSYVCQHQYYTRIRPMSPIISALSMAIAPSHAGAHDG